MEGKDTSQLSQGCPYMCMVCIIVLNGPSLMVLFECIVQLCVLHMHG